MKNTLFETKSDQTPPRSGVPLDAIVINQVSEKIKPHRTNLCSRHAEKMISVKINNRCNRNCSFCVDRAGLDPGFIDEEKIIDSVLRLDTYKTVIVTGGEPFLDFESLLSVLSAIRADKERIVLNTNGSLLTPEKVNRLNGLIDEIQVSIHNPEQRKNGEVLGRETDYTKIKEALCCREFVFSVNSVFNRTCTKAFVGDMIALCVRLGADRLRLTEPKKVDMTEFVSAEKFFSSGHKAISKPRSSLISEGCTEWFTDNGILVSVKRLCSYALGKNATAFSCCFIDTEGQKKIDIDTEDTFKVVYSDGRTVNDWIFSGL